MKNPTAWALTLPDRAHMHTYLVGGAVRDPLLAQAHPDIPKAKDSDRDWVVVGATPAELLALGYRPVGSDFPVFLHPETHEEYALARTERKSGVGYKGFTFHTSPDTTLEQDLARRDLTINAMALPEQALGELDQGTTPQALVDPHGGLIDLRLGVLRHITPAFAEDPLRVLRVARFAARWPRFVVAKDTGVLMQHIVARGELAHLVPERVWQELTKGLMAPQPSRMVQVLVACGAWAALLDPMPCGAAQQTAVDRLASTNAPLAVRFAALWLNASEADHSAFGQRHRVPKACTEVAQVALRGWKGWQALGLGKVAALWPLLQACDALRRPERLGLAAECWTAWSATTPATGEANPNTTRAKLLLALQAALAVRPPASAQGLSGPALGQALAVARQQAAEAAWAQAST